MTKLTEARHRALKEVADGKIVYYMADRLRKKPAYMVDGYWQKPRQETYNWLKSNGYIMHGASLHGATVRLTLVGEEAIGTKNEEGN
jgi:hypothetical protein